MVVKKQCPDCGKTKPREEYGHNRNRPDGLSFYCRACSAVRNAATYRRKQARQGKQVRERVEVPPGHKRCPKCNEVKPHAAWHKRRSSSDGYASYCAACSREINRSQHLRRNYGLTEDELADLVRGQGHLCPICRESRPVHVDHDHATGSVRAVLCFNCNAALGHLRDRPDILRRAASYLEGEVWRPIPTAPGVFRLPS